MDPINTIGQILLGAVGTGVTLYTIGADLLGRGVKAIERRGPATQDVVALTFDDGPHPRFTPRVLDILAQFDARATFFVIGKRAEHHPEIIRAIADAGHEIGNHTYSHRPLWLLTPQQTRLEIERCTQVLSRVLGKPPRYFRPPWGHSNLAAIRHSARVRQRHVRWSLRGEGWLPLASPERIVRTVARRLHPGAIIDLHDGGGVAGTPARLVAALPGLLKLLQERGYRSLTLSELLPEGPAISLSASLRNRAWDRYECAWNAWFGIDKLGPETILTVGPALHAGPDLRLRDGTTIHPGAQVGELHFDRARLAHLHQTVTPRRVGFVLRYELEETLQRLAEQAVQHPAAHQWEAFRSTTLFWREAAHLGFEACGPDSGWRLLLLGWYQRRLLARDHPHGRHRLRGRRLEARTIWLSRGELLRRYAGQQP